MKPRQRTDSRIDFAAAAASANLRALVEQKCGPPGPGRKWRCPWHDDSTPSLSLAPDGKRWKCWGCEAKGDALDWVARDHGVSLVEAAKLIDPSLGDIAPSKRSRRLEPKPSLPPPPAPPTAWEDPDWQAVVEDLVEQAEAALAGPDGSKARDWLQSRGIDLGTAHRFRLGFLPSSFRSRPLAVLADDEGPRPIRAVRGIVMPWLAPGAAYRDDTGDPLPTGPRFVGVNVRRLNEDVFQPWEEPDKCLAVRGSSRGFLYPFADVLPTQGNPPALIVEGEFDALVGWQEAGPLALVGTVGSANQRPHRSVLAALSNCPHWLIATDRDRAGIEAARRWRERAPHKARRALLPFGKDLTDFRTGGGDVRAWLQETFRDLGF